MKISGVSAQPQWRHDSRIYGARDDLQARTANQQKDASVPVSERQNVGFENGDPRQAEPTNSTQGLRNDKKSRGQNDPKQLSPEQKEQLRKLRARDSQVRAHESAHRAAGGQYAGAMHFEYQQGPDGQRYAVGGEVQIDASPVQGDPQATMRKMDQVVRAALAPAQPSDQDRAVASRARARSNKAQRQLTEQRAQERRDAQKASQQASTEKKQTEQNNNKKQHVMKYKAMEQAHQARSSSTASGLNLSA